MRWRRHQLISYYLDDIIDCRHYQNYWLQLISRAVHEIKWQLNILDEYGKNIFITNKYIMGDDAQYDKLAD